MRPKIDDAANLGEERRRDLQASGQQHHRTPSHRRAQREHRRFIVWIHAFGRVREWQRFADRASADAAVGQLRYHGFDARTCEAAP